MHGEAESRESVADISFRSPVGRNMAMLHGLELGKIGDGHGSLGRFGGLSQI